MAGRKLEVEIIGDARALERAFSKSAKDSEAFSSKLTGGATHGLKVMGIAAAGASALVGGGLVFAMKKALDSANEHAKAAAQTNAVIKSTGGAANVTTADILSLTNAMEKKTGVDDLTIQTGANMLLTFTGIRNEVGKGNDVFTQATKTVTDMSVALGEDSKNAAIQLGKALNDPVKGVTALQRVGVSFTEAQKKQIDAMVKSGDTMGAQKLVLGELNKEFGGSAEAMGRTLPGQINILKAHLDDLEQKIGQKLVPVMTSVVTWVTAHWPQISAVVGAVVARISAVMPTVLDAFRTVIAVSKEAVEYIRAHWPQISAVLDKVGAEIQKIFGTIVAVIQGAVTVITALWNAFGSTLLSYVESTFHNLMQVVKGAFDVVEGLFRLFADIIHGRWGQVWQDVQQIVSGAWNVIEGLFSQALNMLVTAAKLIGIGILKAIEVPLKALVHLAGTLMHDLVSAISGIGGAALGAAEAVGKLILKGLYIYYVKIPELAVTWLGKGLKAVIDLADEAFHAAVKIGKALVKGIVSGVEGLPGALAHKLHQGISSAIHTAGGWLHGSGEYMATKHLIGVPLGKGTIEGWILGSQPLPAAISKTVRAAIEHARSIVASERGVFSSAWGVLTADATKAFDVQTSRMLDAVKTKFNAAKAQLDQQTKAALAGLDAQGQVLTPEEQKVQDEQDAHDEAGRQQAISDAQAQLSQARAAGDAQQQLAAQRQLDDALYQEQLVADQKAAAASRKAEDDKIAAQKKVVEEQAKEKKAALDADQKRTEQHLREQRSLEKQRMEEQLKELKKQLERTGATQREAQEKVIAMLKGYGITYKSSGRLLGEEFAKGLLAAEGDVSAAAARIAQAAANNLQLHSPAKTGPLSTLDTWWKPLGPTLVKGIDTRATDAALARVAAGAAGLSRGGGLGSVATSGGDTHFHLHLDGATIIGNDKRQVAEELVREITLAQRNYQRLGGPSPVG